MYAVTSFNKNLTWPYVYINMGKDVNNKQLMILTLREYNFLPFLYPCVASDMINTTFSSKRIFNHVIT